MLIRTGPLWFFESELALENVVFDHLKSHFGLTPLKRQYQCRGEICDIVSVDDEQRLVILELKNTEDRYIVQQLTRYYDSLQEERPWSEQIDYSKPVRLIAIAPGYHRHNFVDRKYSSLNIEFLTFEIAQAGTEFWLKLKSVAAEIASQIRLSYTEFAAPPALDLQSPPQMLLDSLGGWSGEAQAAIMELRNQILRFDPRMQEVAEKLSIFYGRGKSNRFAEFYFDWKQKKPVLFLWLPIWNYRKKAIGRHRIWTDWADILYFAHVPEGLGKAKPMEEWNQIPQEKWPRKYLDSGKIRLTATPYNIHLAAAIGCKEPTLSLFATVNAALEHWQERG